MTLDMNNIPLLKIVMSLIQGLSFDIIITEYYNKSLDLFQLWERANHFVLFFKLLIPYNDLPVLTDLHCTQTKLAEIKFIITEMFR